MKKLRVKLPPTFYKWSWRLVPSTWVVIEWLAINDEDEGSTWTAHTRPVIQDEPLLKAAFICFIAWLTKHYLLDKSEKLS